MTSKISPDLFLSSYQKKERKTGDSNLGKDDFLKILMTQLQHQDPMNPLQDKDFIAQMATFSTLEQITNMAQSFDALVQRQNETNLVTYQQMIGKEIKWHKTAEDEEGNSNIETGTGVVQSLLYENGSVVFALTDGTTLTPANISEVHEMPIENCMVQASQLINKKLTWQDGNGAEHEAAVSSVIFKNGKATFVMNDDNQSNITVDQVMKISQ
ncbi:flagellar hook assembly protein FlgD [Bacillus songklensis]|uniref:Basal-body rod modification protein FlgD n=1 Tax=Bacillus songklensis TaxID=1069116 RepID=A0ABV8B0A8_9BACI